MRHDTVLETERLILRPLAERDAAAFYAISNAPEAMRFWTTGAHRSPAESDVVIARMLAGTERAWAICLQPNDEAIGIVHYLGNDGAPGMGYLLHPAHWGKGLMSEAVEAALKYGFENLGLARVELWIDSRNNRSRKLADRLGFTCRSAFRQKYPRDRASHEKLVYGLRAEEWNAASSARFEFPVRPYTLQPVLAVQDVAATARYYEDALGFRIGFLFGDPPTYGAVVLNEWMATGAQIHLRKVSHTPVSADLSLYLDTGPGLEQLFERYRAKGVTIIAPPTAQPWGTFEFTIADCNGYQLCFSTPC